MFRFILLFLAASIVLAHNALPHQHHSEMDEMEHLEEHSHSASFLDYLQLAFHLDMGGDHLETFEKTGELSLAIPMIAEPVYYSPLLLHTTEKSVTNTYFSYSDWHSPVGHFWNETSFRGPPTA